MKLKCKKATTDESNGFLGIGAHGPEPIDGLTKGNTYTGELVPIVNTIMEGTRIDEDDICVMIYNDNEEWETYDINLFEPI